MATESTKKSQTSKSKKTQQTAGRVAEPAEATRRLRVPPGVLTLQKRVIERQRSAFDATFQVVQSFQEGRESAFHNLLEGSSFVPTEWRLIAEAWIENARRSRESFRDTVDTSFGLAEQLVDRLGADAPRKSAAEA